MSFISLLVICSASWSIKHIKRSDVNNATDSYDAITPDTSDYFKKKDTYNNTDQAPIFLDDNIANILYGMSAEEAAAAGKYKVIWQTGTYNREVNGSLTIPDKTYSKNSGTHYYRIVDDSTGTVICYKHEFVIDRDTINDTIDVSNNIDLGAKFPWDSVTYDATWTGDKSGESRSLPSSEKKNNISNLMAITDNATFFTELTKVFDPSILFAKSDELFLNNHTFDGNDTVKLTYAALATAYSTDGTSKKYYGTIVDAIKGTTSTATVVAMQGFSYGEKNYTAGSVLELAQNGVDITKTIQGDYYHKIDTDCTVAAGVTLLIPYDTTMSYYDESSKAYTLTQDNGALIKTNPKKSAYDNVDTDGKPIHLKNSILVTKGKTLTNNGNIIIPGIITGGSGGSSITSVTADAHSRINLAGGAKIVNATDSSNITCYGYIDELGDNTKVDIAKGNLNVVFSIVEHRGGAIFLAMGGGFLNAALGNYKIKDSSPFNRFYVESVTSQIEVTEGATVKGFYNVYVQEPISGNVGFFGIGSSYFVGFDSTDGKTSKAFLKYDSETDQNKLTVQGNASINKLDVEVKMSGVSLLLSTQDVYMPLSHYWSLLFQRFNGDGDAATITATGQDIKIMPGASVTVDEGVTFKAKNIAVYTKTTPSMGNAGGFDYFAKADEDATSTFVATEASTYVDGSLIVGGALELTGALGGYVEAQGNNASLKIASTSISLKELETSSGTGTNGEVTYTSATLTATGPIATSDSTSSTAGISNTLTYTSINGAWFKSYATITLDPNGGVAGDTSIELPVDRSKGVTNLYALTNAITPTRDGFRFAGWYLDSAGTKTVADNLSQIKYDTRIYAKWYPVITLALNANGGSVKDSSGNEISSVQFVLGADSIADIIGDLTVTFPGNQFIGWYLDAEFNKSVTEHASEITSDTTLYAKWEALEVSVNLTLDYTTNASGKDFGSSVTLSNKTDEYAPGTTVTLPTGYNSIDTNTGIAWYLAGWKDANGNTVTSVTLEEGDVTVYADWQQKIYLTIKSADGNNRYSDIVTYGTTWYKPGSTYSVTLPDVYANDANTSEQTMWYLKSWTFNSEALGEDDVDTTRTFTESTTIEITWATKHKVTISIVLDRSDCNGSIVVNGVTYSKATNNNTSVVLYFHPTKQTVTIGDYNIVGVNGLFGIGRRTTTLSVSGGITINKSTYSSSGLSGTGGTVTLSEGGSTTISITDN